MSTSRPDLPDGCRCSDILLEMFCPFTHYALRLRAVVFGEHDADVVDQVLFDRSSEDQLLRTTIIPDNVAFISVSGLDHLVFVQFGPRYSSA